MVFLAATLFVTGLKTIIPRMIVSHRAVVIGISFMLGISRDIYPQVYEGLPSIMQTMTGSSIAFATLCAIFLNLIALMSIDNTKIARIILRDDATGYKQGIDYLESLKKDWVLPLSLFEHVHAAYCRLMENFIKNKISKDLITVDIQLTRSQLDMVLSYNGPLIKLINQKNINKTTVENDAELFIPHASKVTYSKEEKNSSLLISFDY